MTRTSLMASLGVILLTLVATPMMAVAQDEDIDRAQRDLEKLMESYSAAAVAEAFARAGITIPGRGGFRGMRYTEYHLQRKCWVRGPQAGLTRNDNCITYHSTCAMGGGGSKLTVTKPSGDQHIRIYDDNREVYACEATIHMPQDEEQVIITPSRANSAIRR